MTEFERIRAEQDADSDAESLGLLLLLAFRTRDGRTLGQVSFDRFTGRFTLNGRMVAVRSIINYLERINEKMARRLVTLTNDLQAGRVTFDEWKRGFDRTITSTHILAGAFAVGGIVAASRSAILNAQLSEQLAFADKFANEIRNGKAGTFAAIGSRAKSYIHAAHITYSHLELAVVQETGFRKEAFNLLRPAEHCFRKERIGCPELTAKGWMQVGEMIPIGQRQCGPWCKCRVIYR